jgi:hypothetical protein
MVRVEGVSFHTHGQEGGIQITLAHHSTEASVTALGQGRLLHRTAVMAQLRMARFPGIMLMDE